MTSNELHLVALAKLGDNAAFKELYVMNKEKIFHLTYQYSQNLQDAEDLLQETFSKAFLSIQRFNAQDNARFSTWLYRIGINCSLNFVKKRMTLMSKTAPTHPDEVESLACKSKNPEEQAAVADLYLQLDEGLEALSANQRMVFILKHKQGLKAREIAAYMDCSEGTVKQHLSRAVASLMKRLAVVPAGDLK